MILSKLEQVLVLASRKGLDLDYEPGEKNEHGVQIDALTMRHSGAIRYRVKAERKDLWSAALAKLEEA